MGGRRNKKKEGRRNSGEKEERKKIKKCCVGFKLVRLVLLVVLSVEREGVVGRIGFTFLPS